MINSEVRIWLSLIMRKNRLALYNEAFNLIESDECKRWECGACVCRKPHSCYAFNGCLAQALRTPTGGNLVCDLILI